MENTTTTSTTTTAPYVMSDETKTIIYVVLSFFIIPLVICFIVTSYDLTRHFFGIREFRDGIIMSHRKRMYGVKPPKKPSIIIEYINVEEDCPICLEKLDGKIGHLECNHYFHEKCLNQWVKNSINKDCPICRKN